MAPPIAFSATDSIIFVILSTPPGLEPYPEFKIHERLLHGASSTLASELDQCTEYRGDGTKVLRVLSPFHGFEVFARWLYGDTIGKHEMGGGWAAAFDILLQGYAVGQNFRVVNFQDAVMDEITAFLIDPQDNITAEEVIPVFLKHFPADSKGRELAAHWLVYTNGICGRYEIGIVVKDADFTQQLATAFLEAKSPQTKRRTKRSAPIAVGTPYEEDPCVYHVHKDLGLPCYKYGGEEGAK